MKGAVKRNTFPSTGRRERETSWTASPDSVETILRIRLRRKFDHSSKRGVVFGN